MAHYYDGDATSEDDTQKFGQKDVITGFRKRAGEGAVVVSDGFRQPKSEQWDYVGCGCHCGRCLIDSRCPILYQTDLHFIFCICIFDIMFEKFKGQCS